MILLAIDPGFERVGVAIIQKEKGGKELLLHSECFKTSATLLFAERLLLIHNKLIELCELYKPQLFAIETLFMTTNQKTAINVAQARGVMLVIAQKYNLVIHEYTPLQIKVAVTGYGKSDKKAVMSMVPKIIHMEDIKHSDDELDAIAIGLTCIAHARL